ncbi:SRPBCC domain-containing protein [Arthrobacter sp. 35W]|uniref:SRPBCC domain-containing protein n=1 Tax=Arthrobacter sp. 35W TaxID=1132441 RepID=UPI000685969F|nr:SRPBCC domain-containing protein [Arthrobacter sp. 35W]
MPAGPGILWSYRQGDGFRTNVAKLDLREGGELIYTMTAVAPEQIAFMEQQGMPLATESKKTFTEIAGPERLAYSSLIDFVPDHGPYAHLTVVELAEVDGGTEVTIRVEQLHDEVWTGRLLAGRANELDNLAKLVS